MRGFFCGRIIVGGFCGRILLWEDYFVGGFCGRIIVGEFCGRIIKFCFEGGFSLSKIRREWRLRKGWLVSTRTLEPMQICHFLENIIHCWPEQHFGG